MNDPKNLFTLLEKLFKNKFGEVDMQMYETIVNITFVFMGVRPACTAYFKKSKDSKKYIDIFDAITNYNENMKVLHHNYTSNNNLWYNYIFINLKMIAKHKLSKEYVNVLNNKFDHVDMGKLLGFPCPIDIFKHFDDYEKKNDDNLRKRYIYEYILYKKNKNTISLENRTQLFAYICYSDNENNNYYKKSIKQLKLYQENLLLLTNDFHIGLTYSEEII